MTDIVVGSREEPVGEDDLDFPEDFPEFKIWEISDIPVDGQVTD